MPKFLDLFCGAGGAAMGYHLAGFDDITGVDIKPQPRYPFHFIQADALEYLAEHGGEYDAIHASPPCQGYSVMNNLPWLKGRDYPLLILPCIEMLETLGKAYVLENVMGARHGAKGLAKRGLESHGLKAGWLCGTMFGLPFYRHRLFATNWFWLQPGHPKHTMNLHPRSERYVYGGTVKGLPGGAAGMHVKPKGGTLPHGYADGNRVLALRQYTRSNGKVEITTQGSPTEPGYGLTQWQNANGAQVAGCGVGNAKGWRLAAEAMGIDWMKRAELTQAIPPAYTRYIGEQLMRVQWTTPTPLKA